MMTNRTRQVSFGGVTIGGGRDVLIQSMTNTDTQDAEETCAQIGRLEAAGCEAVRCAFYHADCAGAFREIKKNIGVPLIADVHFDAELAVRAIENGADKVRVNPGNIGGNAALRKVVDCAKQNGAAIRIGVNAGSLEKELTGKYGGPIPIALAESAMNSVRFVYDMDFYNVVVSIKSSSVPDTVAACRLFSDACDAPMHIGITEAGTYMSAVIKSAVGLGALLVDGIGDTIRVSITGDPVQEIDAAKRILQSAGLRTFFPEVISCPTCARTSIDVESLARKVEQILTEMDKPVTAAVMGCIVNGPGEARHADIGIAGGKGKAALFSKGTLVGTYAECDILAVFKDYIEKNF
ncbi:MAG: flavodoxin-dependent (E)-4-hydroxy-3-methylbut-2-enyl-diphosphate synthase [Eubacteriales bacterium]|nr:flavodoxin-dependent (E)-4-hydroxy-3-methylbut-2-enyl-diphosphate synthase [Eubacteriales bacterium]